jgi:hypothetical protein
MLKPSADRKVWAYKNQKNTLGLLPGPEGTCPGATLGPDGCRSVVTTGRPACYVYRLMSIYKNVKGVLEHNTHLLKNADKAKKVTLLDTSLTASRRYEKKDILTRLIIDCTGLEIYLTGSMQKRLG